jgi:hypothetical protein
MNIIIAGPMQLSDKNTGMIKCDLKELRFIETIKGSRFVITPPAPIAQSRQGVMSGERIGTTPKEEKIRMPAEPLREVMPRGPMKEIFPEEV